MKNSKLLFPLLAALLFVTSCTTGRGFTQPQTSAPTVFRGADTTASPDSSIAFVPWRRFFPDPVLRDLIDTVLLRNYDRRIALDNIRLSNEYLKQAKAGWLPTAGIGVSAGLSRFSDNSLNGKNGFDLNDFVGISRIEDYTASAGLSWEPDIWGKIRNRKKEALAIYLQTEEVARALQTRLITETATAYYNLLLLHEQIAIARRNLALSDSTVAMIRLQAEAGDATELAVEQAAAQQKDIEGLLPSLEQALAREEHVLSLLMARAPGEIRVGDTHERFAMPADWSAGVPVALLARRPDVRESEQAAHAAHARKGVARASMYPSLSISAAGGLNSFRASDWLTLPASLFGNVAGNLLQPITDRRRLKTELRASGIRYEQAVTAFRSQVLKAVTEVSDALILADKLGRKINIAAEQQAILHKAVPDARLLYENGMASYLEVITARQKLLENELQLADLKRQQTVAYLNLYRAVGGGVD